MESVLILGAAGRLGHAVATAFRAAGWAVVGQVRPGGADRLPEGVEPLEADALDGAAIRQAARDCSVVVNALNPAYTDWPKHAKPLALAGLEASRSAGATLLYPGNVYSLGRRLGPVIADDAPHYPDHRKGQIRAEFEEALKAATEEGGPQVLVLRAGDFYGSDKTGSWLDLVIAKNIAKNRFVWPGPTGVVHQWAYLPDLARAFVAVAERRADCERFEAMGMPGPAVTGKAFHAAAEKALGRKLKQKGFAWPLVRAMGLVMPMMREVAEMDYLWQVPHRLATDRFDALVPDFRLTGFEESVSESLAALGHASGSSPAKS